MPDYLKIHLVHFSITLSGHINLVFQGSFTPLCPCSSPFIRLPVIQGNSYPAFPIIISPSVWYCRPWSLTAYGYAPGLNRGNDTSSIRNIWSDQPPFVRFYSDYGRLVSLLRSLAFVSPAESMVHNSWCILFCPVCFWHISPSAHRHCINSAWSGRHNPACKAGNYIGFPANSWWRYVRPGTLT